MKKVIILLILILWGCRSSSDKSSPFIDSDSLKIMEYDSTLYPPNYIDVESEEQVAQLDSQRKIKKDDGKDDSILDSKSKRPFEISELDTASLLPEIKRNKEVIHKQQIVLDSLLKKK